MALRNTLVYSATILPLDLARALGLALLINRKLRGMAIFRTVFLLPVICSTVAVALLWGLMLDPYVGLINFVLRLLNLPAQGWFTDARQALPLIILMSLWKGVGYDAALFLAGLQGVSPELYEVATIDGVTRWRQFRHITLPLLTPTTFFVITNALITSIQVFEYTWILTKGGPQNATTTMVFYIYQQGFQRLRMGHASAIAYVLFVVLAIIMIVHWRLQRRWVHYT